MWGLDQGNETPDSWVLAFHPRTTVLLGASRAMPARRSPGLFPTLPLTCYNIVDD